MSVPIFPEQQAAVDQLSNGKVLVGGVGSGKTRTGLLYVHDRICGGDNSRDIGPSKPVHIYIITIARKRDTLDWEGEAALFGISTKKLSPDRPWITVDSWNNIKKYVDVDDKDAFFIFDEQRAIGSGAWSKSFLKITKKRPWIMLSATPGDTFMDYVSLFVANGLYKNRTEFVRRHVVYSRFTKFPKIDRFIGTGVLEHYRQKLLVVMKPRKRAKEIHEVIPMPYDEVLYRTVTVKRWDPWKDEPIKQPGYLPYLQRRVVNANKHRLKATKDILDKHRKLIVFYNFHYERKMLLRFGETLNMPVRQYNGIKHEPVPTGNDWLYIAQYTSSAEAWECITTDAILFFSWNYSYRIMYQSSGRINRLSTPFEKLYYYYLHATNTIDDSIKKSVDNKEKFNEGAYVRQHFT